MQGIMHFSFTYATLYRIFMSSKVIFNAAELVLHFIDYLTIPLLLNNYFASFYILFLEIMPQLTAFYMKVKYYKHKF